MILGSSFLLAISKIKKNQIRVLNKFCSLNFKAVFCCFLRDLPSIINYNCPNHFKRPNEEKLMILYFLIFRKHNIFVTLDFGLINYVF